MGAPLSKHIEKLFPNMYAWSVLHQTNSNDADNFWLNNDNVMEELDEYNSILIEREIRLGGKHSIHKIN